MNGRGGKSHPQGDSIPSGFYKVKNIKLFFSTNFKNKFKAANLKPFLPLPTRLPVSSVALSGSSPLFYH